jgi:hypothetical protein
MPGNMGGNPMGNIMNNIGMMPGTQGGFAGNQGLPRMPGMGGMFNKARGMIGRGMPNLGGNISSAGSQIGGRQYQPKPTPMDMSKGMPGPPPQGLAGPQQGPDSRMQQIQSLAGKYGVNMPKGFDPNTHKFSGMQKSMAQMMMSKDDYAKLQGLLGPQQQGQSNLGPGQALRGPGIDMNAVSAGAPGEQEGQRTALGDSVNRLAGYPVTPSSGSTPGGAAPQQGFMQQFKNLPGLSGALGRPNMGGQGIGAGYKQLQDKSRESAKNLMKPVKRLGFPGSMMKASPGMKSIGPGLKQYGREFMSGLDAFGEKDPDIRRRTGENLFPKAMHPLLNKIRMGKERDDEEWALDRQAAKNVYGKQNIGRNFRSGAEELAARGANNARAIKQYGRDTRSGIGALGDDINKQYIQPAMNSRLGQLTQGGVEAAGQLAGQAGSAIGRGAAQGGDWLTRQQHNMTGGLLPRTNFQGRPQTDKDVGANESPAQYKARQPWLIRQLMGK